MRRADVCFEDEAQLAGAQRANEHGHQRAALHVPHVTNEEDGGGGLVALFLEELFEQLGGALGRAGAREDAGRGQLEHAGVEQPLGGVALHDAAREFLHHGALAHAGFTCEQRGLAAAREQGRQLGGRLIEAVALREFAGGRERGEISLDQRLGGVPGGVLVLLRHGGVLLRTAERGFADDGTASKWARGNQAPHPRPSPASSQGDGAQDQRSRNVPSNTQRRASASRPRLATIGVV